MKKYILYFSDGTILEIESSSSTRLYQVARNTLKSYEYHKYAFTSCLCKKCNPVEELHDTPMWVMTCDPFDGIRFTKWNADKAHKLLARQTFLFNSPYDADWINRLFEMPNGLGGYISLEKED